MSDGWGDEQRFEELYRVTYPDIVAYCRRRLPPDTVDDVVATTFLVAWRRIEDVLDADSSLAWLYGVAYKIVGNHIRGRNRLRALRDKALRQPPQRIISTEHAVELSDELHQALAALDSLTPRDREVIRLAAFENLSLGEIVQVIGGTPASARSQLYRARKRLRIAFETQNGNAR